jgi:hypothetical protein
MNKRISDIFDCVEYCPLRVREEKTQSSERIIDLTMKKITADEAADGGVTRRARRRFAAVAVAAVLVVTALSATAFAIYRFGLRDLAGPAQIGAERVGTLSLNGLAGSAEYEAAREWESHVDAWYANGENLFTPDMTPDAYTQYNAASQEAKDTLDGILGKYSLKMHNMPGYVRTDYELYAALGVGGFMPDAGDSGEYPVSGTYYDDGTFTFNSAAALPGGIDVRYQLYHLVRGSFTRIGYLLADADDFEEWVYTAKGGADVLLAVGANRSAMAAELDGGFVFVNILSGTENSDESLSSYGAAPIDKRALEAFADGFDLAAIDGINRQGT